MQVLGRDVDDHDQDKAENAPTITCTLMPALHVLVLITGIALLVLL